MKIGMVGMGKLGLPTALAIESKGHAVIGYDVAPEPYEYIMEGAIPYDEAGLQPLLDTTDIYMADDPEELMDCDIIFLAIQTPHAPEFEGTVRLTDRTEDFNYTYLLDALQTFQEYTGVLAVISTCLPGTYRREIAKLPLKGSYVYTPQFIAMGTVLQDYLYPEFNLIGVEDESSALMEEFNRTINDAPNIVTDITTAEGIKVSYNTWVTAKTVIANTWGEIAYRTGMDFDALYKAWSLSDKRLLSNRYMRAGMSDGGGCHPRDNIALSHLAKKIHLSHDIFRDLMQAREDYENWHAELAITAAKVNNLPLIILGKAFKPETNIETGSPAILLANLIQEKGFYFEHYEDLDDLPEAVYFIATNHPKYQDYAFSERSIVINPHKGHHEN